MSQDPSQNPENVEELLDDEVELSSQAHDQGVQHDDNLLATEVEALKAQLAEAKEQVIRAAAEAQNTKRRAEQDVEKAHKYGIEKFVGDMLPVADNLERAIDAAKNQQGSFETVIEGVELTLKTLIDALKRHNVESVNPVGEPFDPQLHQAMTMVPDPNVEPNTVINVFQPGYTLNGRLVRPAMVVVSKGQ